MLRQILIHFFDRSFPLGNCCSALLLISRALQQPRSYTLVPSRFSRSDDSWSVFALRQSSSLTLKTRAQVSLWSSQSDQPPTLIISSVKTLSSQLLALKLIPCTATFPGAYILILGIPFLLIIVLCVLGCFGYFGCVMGNGITHCCRRSRMRREEARRRRREHLAQKAQTKEYERRLRMQSEYDRQHERRQNNELRAFEKARKRALKMDRPKTTSPRPRSSDYNFSEHHPPTHGSSASVPGDGTRSASSIRSPPPLDGASIAPSDVSARRSRLQKRNQSPRMTAWVQPSVSRHSSMSSDQRPQQQNRYYGHSAGASSHLAGGRTSSTSRHSEERLLGSVGSSSRLFESRANSRP